MKVADEERKKVDAEYVNRGLAKDPVSIEVGVIETTTGTGKVPRIPIGYVEANGERYEIGRHTLNLS
jgi:hypothetical protein